MTLLLFLPLLLLLLFFLRGFCFFFFFFYLCSFLSSVFGPDEPLLSKSQASFAAGKGQRFQVHTERPTHLDAGDISWSRGVQPQMTTLLCSCSRAMFNYLQLRDNHCQRNASVEFAGQRMQSHAIRVCERRHLVEGCSLQNEYCRIVADVS